MGNIDIMGNNDIIMKQPNLIICSNEIVITLLSEIPKWRNNDIIMQNSEDEVLSVVPIILYLGTASIEDVDVPRVSCDLSAMSRRC